MPRLGRNGEIPPSWEEIANFDCIESLAADVESEHTERLYQTRPGVFALVQMTSEDDPSKTVRAMSRSEAAKWYLATHVPEQLRAMFGIGT